MGWKRLRFALRRAASAGRGSVRHRRGYVGAHCGMRTVPTGGARAALVGILWWRASGGRDRYTGFAGVAFCPKGMFGTIAVRALVRFEEFNPQGFSNTAWAFARWACGVENYNLQNLDKVTGHLSHGLDVEKGSCKQIGKS